MDSDDLTFENYQELSRRTAIYPGQGTLAGLVYVLLGMGESGELQGKVKKLLRDNKLLMDTPMKDIPQELKNAIAKELGDSLWYVSQVAEELGISLGQIATENLQKLQARQESGVLGGSGDNRENIVHISHRRDVTPEVINNDIKNINKRLHPEKPDASL
jgi:NTP pyrophosphatase (non-canonical NTP hydrolase)